MSQNNNNYLLTGLNSISSPELPTSLPKILLNGKAQAIFYLELRQQLLDSDIIQTVGHALKGLLTDGKITKYEEIKATIKVALKEDMEKVLQKNIALPRSIQKQVLSDWKAKDMKGQIECSLSYDDEVLLN